MVLLAATLALAADFLRPEPLSTFDGQTWSGLSFGDTDDEIKRRFRTSKGAFRPEGLVLAQPNRDDPKVEALLDGRGKNARTIGIFLSYNDLGPNLDRVREDLNTDPEIWYAPERYDEWAIVAWPERAIAAVVVGSGRVQRTANAMLLRPGDYARMTSSLDQRPGRIRDPREIFERNPPRLEFGRPSVSLNLKGIDVRDKGALERDLADDIERRRLPEEMRFRRGAGDSYSVFVNATYDSDKHVTNITVNATLSGDTGYGRVSGTGSASDSYRSADNPYWGNTRYLSYAVERATRDAERDASDRIRRQRPPTPDQIRNGFLFDLMNRNVR